MVKLTEHFSLGELTKSETAERFLIDNTPSAAQVLTLQRLADELLEPSRSLLGALHVNSGFRCPTLNTAVHGQPTSAHLDGRAADLVPVNRDIHEAFDVLRESDLPYDQLILEHDSKKHIWLHIAIARDGVTPRRQAFGLTLRDNRAVS